LDDRVITTNWGNFRGTNAKSLIAARISNNIVANAGFATGFQYGGIGTRAGLTFAWQRATNLRPVSPV
jgi:trimeric autotransporter adhesin